MKYWGKYVGVIYRAFDCPTCTGMEYHRLKWFNTIPDVIEFVRTETRNGLFIHQLWEEDLDKQSPLYVTYDSSRHAIVSAKVINDGKVLVRVTRDPYDFGKEWKIEVTDDFPFAVGDRVFLKETPEITPEKADGWIGCEHFLIKGATGTIKEVHYNRLSLGIEFDDESYIDSEGKEVPIKDKHLFGFGMRWIERID